MTATAFHNISIILIIISAVGMVLLIILGDLEKVSNVFAILAVSIAMTLGLAGIISYATYKEAAEEYAVPEQMSYWNWITFQWIQETACPNCGTEVPLKYTYCPECGYGIKERVVCPECGGAIQPTDIYCPWCGTDLCPECGGAIQETDVFCPWCGAEL